MNFFKIEKQLTQMFTSGCKKHNHPDAVYGVNMIIYVKYTL